MALIDKEYQLSLREYDPEFEEVRLSPASPSSDQQPH